MDVKEGTGRCSRLMVAGIICILGLEILGLLMINGVISTREKVLEPCSNAATSGPVTADEEYVDDIQTNISKSFYGRSKEGEDIHKYSFVNKNGLQLDVITLGGIITKLTAPCRHGHLRDIIAGYGSPSQYISDNPSYFGGLIGRYANRIRGGQFTLDGVGYQLKKNDGSNHLHGGNQGWDRKVWKATQHHDHISLSYISPDNDELYPGEVKVTVTFQLTNDNEVIINYTANVYKKATPINLTSHPYFNLGGQGNRTIYDHNVTIHADKYVEVDNELIPTGNLIPVEGTLRDFNAPVQLGDRILNVTDGTRIGLNNCFVLKGPTGKRLAAKVYHPHSGRILEVFTNQPAVQFYTGNFLDEACGKECVHYGQHSSFCLETQNYLDAVNHDNFPDSILRPGSTYLHQVWYKIDTDSSHGKA